jgi:GDP-L-fucose synthase
MTILVAGSTGLVGSAIIRELNRVGKPAVGISSKDVNLLDRNSTFDYLNNLKPSTVINAAAKVGGINANNRFPVEFLSENIQMQTNLMDAAHQTGVKKLVFFGASCIYPKNCHQPIKEDYLLTGELEQTNSAYAIAKISGLELVKSYRKQYNHSWISIMPTTIYGPNDSFDLEMGHVLPVLIRKFIEAKKNNIQEVILWGTGQPLREFLYADDLAKAVLVCLEKYDKPQQINIGSGIEVTIKDLAQKISTQVGFSGRITWDSSRPDGTPRKVLDTTKIKNLGWEPSTSLDQGIKTTIEWYLENSTLLSLS